MPNDAMNQREKAARKVQARITEMVGYPFTLPPSRNELADAYSKLSIDLQVAVDEAVELIDRLLGEVVGPFADKTIVDESADWLSRNERKEV